MDEFGRVLSSGAPCQTDECENGSVTRGIGSEIESIPEDLDRARIQVQSPTMSTPERKTNIHIKHDDIVRIIEDKYDRYIREIIDNIRAMPSKSKSCEFEDDDDAWAIDDNAWEDWRSEQRSKSSDTPESAANIARDECAKNIRKLPDDELALLWTMTHEYDNVTRLEGYWTYGEPMRSSVTQELYRRIQEIAAEPPISLHSFILTLVYSWNEDRLKEQAECDETDEEPVEESVNRMDDRDNNWFDDRHRMPSAAAVTRTIWDADETGGWWCLGEDDNPSTIADVLEFVGKDCFGGWQWQEMENYINRLTPYERRMMNLSEFIEIFYGVLLGDGPPAN